MIGVVSNNHVVNPSVYKNIPFDSLADITLPDGERAGQTARTTLLPLAMDGQRLGVRLQPPVLGQHTAALMQELGYTPEQVQALQQAGAVA